VAAAPRVYRAELSSRPSALVDGQLGRLSSRLTNHSSRFRLTRRDVSLGPEGFDLRGSGPGFSERRSRRGTWTGASLASRSLWTRGSVMTGSEPRWCDRSSAFPGAAWRHENRIRYHYGAFVVRWMGRVAEDWPMLIE
jgi:hypothetical protein